MTPTISTVLRPLGTLAGHLRAWMGLAWRVASYLGRIFRDMAHLAMLPRRLSPVVYGIKFRTAQEISRASDWIREESPLREKQFFMAVLRPRWFWSEEHIVVFRKGVQRLYYYDPKGIRCVDETRIIGQTGLTPSEWAKKYFPQMVVVSNRTRNQGWYDGRNCGVYVWHFMQYTMESLRRYQPPENIFAYRQIEFANPDIS